MENKLLSIALYIALPILIQVFLFFVSGRNRRVLMCGMAVVLVSVLAIFWMKNLDSRRVVVREECQFEYNADVPEEFRRIRDEECGKEAVSEEVILNGRITRVGVIVADVTALLFAIWFAVAGKGEEEMKFEKAAKAKTKTGKKKTEKTKK